MLDWLVNPVIRHLDRKRWRDDLSRRSSYAELSFHAATYARAASCGGYKEDALALVALSETLARLGRTPPALVGDVLKEAAA